MGYQIDSSAQALRQMALYRAQNPSVSAIALQRLIALWEQIAEEEYSGLR
jgi:hypothetical protein